MPLTSPADVFSHRSLFGIAACNLRL